MQVRAAHAAKIRIIRGGKKKTHSSAFVKFETFVFKAAHAAKIRIIRGGKKKTHSPAFVKFETFVFKKLRDACAPCYLDFYWGSSNRY